MGYCRFGCDASTRIKQLEDKLAWYESRYGNQPEDGASTPESVPSGGGNAGEIPVRRLLAAMSVIRDCKPDDTRNVVVEQGDEENPWYGVDDGDVVDGGFEKSFYVNLLKVNEAVVECQRILRGAYAQNGDAA